MPWIIKIAIVAPGVLLYIDIFTDVFESGAAELFLLVVYLAALSVLLPGFLPRPLADVEDRSNGPSGG